MTSNARCLLRKMKKEDGGKMRKRTKANEGKNEEMFLFCPPGVVSLAMPLCE